MLFGSTHSINVFFFVDNEYRKSKLFWLF